MVERLVYTEDVGGSSPSSPTIAAHVVAVAADHRHAFGKPLQAAITLVAGLGVAGDAHFGITVQHRSRVAKDPGAANLRQVHLIHAELYDELRDRGFDVGPGQLGENVTLRGQELLALPTGARLILGDAEVMLTGLRNPCRQIDGVAPGLMQAVLARAADGRLIRKAGVMAVVTRGGTVSAGDAVGCVLPPPPHRALEPV